MSNLSKKTAELSIEQRTILEQRLKQKHDFNIQQQIPPRERTKPVPLSFSQKRLWFLDQLDPGNTTYNIPSAFHMEGDLNIPILTRCLNEVVQRHEVLRTTFTTHNGQPIQIIKREQDNQLSLIDLAALPLLKREAQAQSLLTTDANRAFNLVTGPLLRTTLLKLGVTNHIMMINMHHIISDAWSAEIFVREVALLYRAFIEKEPISLPPLPIQYGDFATWQQQKLQGQVVETQLTYWQQKLAGAPSLLELPADYPRPAKQTFAGAQYTFTISPPVTKAIRALAQQEEVTLFIMLLTAFNILLYRYTNQNDIVVGSPIANRNRVELEGLIGFFLNILVLRTDLSGNPQFRTLLKQVKVCALEAYSHQELPFEKLVEELNLTRDLSRNPLFQVMFTVQNQSSVSLSLPNLHLTPIQTETKRSNFDLTFIIGETEDTLNGTIEFSTDLFQSNTIVRLAEHFQNLLNSIIVNPNTPIAQLSLMADHERQQLLKSWNDTHINYAKDLCVHTLFEAQVTQRPDKLAIIFGEQSCTYHQLNCRANQLAHYLQSIGVAPQQLVGVCMERSLQMVVAIWAVLKAGGAYVPLDPTYPQQRLAFVLRDTQIHSILTKRQFVSKLPVTERVICLDEIESDVVEAAQTNLATAVTSSNLAYVIHTSGSTGKPKGIMVTHRNVHNFFVGMDAKIGDDKPGTWAAVTSISFDISVLELLWTLARGYRVVIQAEKDLTTATADAAAIAQQPMAFSLFYFSSANSNDHTNRYKLLIEGAKFADRHGFSAVWTPERHFHDFGGLYPNPSLTSAALATITQTLQIRAGSVVLPLHHPVRLAEDWSVVDNLSNGRVGIAFASGWHANDFIFAPHNYHNRKEITWQGIDIVRRLWRNEAVSLPSGTGNNVDIKIFPSPVQPELPIWITAAGNPETFAKAGQMGANLLTHLLGQDLNELREKVAIYREAWQKHGHGPQTGHITVMLHTFVSDDLDSVREKVYHPFRDYLRSSLGLLRNLAESFNMDIDNDTFSQDDIEMLLDHAFERYFQTSGLFGTPTSCLAMINNLKAIGIDEVACLIDFGVDSDDVLANLSYLDKLKTKSNPIMSDDEKAYTLATQIEAWQVTHLQCTPSMAQMITLDTEAGQMLGRLKKLFLGGEALPQALMARLRSATTADIYNMYGPTETTIWSSVQHLTEPSTTITIGTPIANTQIYILTPYLYPVPTGVVGELVIGGDGVVNGYLNRPRLTAERFIPDPFSDQPGARLYKTGDLVRYSPESGIKFLGRIDYQVKVRGFRIELGEIETILNQHRHIREAILIAREDRSGHKQLIAYFVPDNVKPTVKALRDHLKQHLPDYMIPALFVPLDTFPLTPNGKINRLALPTPEAKRANLDAEFVPPQTATEETLANIWSNVLGLGKVGIHDNFFELGGDSILSTQIVSQIKQVGYQLTLRQFFEHQTIAELATIIEETFDPAQGQTVMKGIVPLTPRQNHFFQHIHSNQPDCSQWVLLHSKQIVDPARLNRALQYLIHQHDVLGNQFEKIENQWQQKYIGSDAIADFTYIDFSTLATQAQDQAMMTTMTLLSSRFRPEKAALVQGIQFHLGSKRADHLGIIVHQLLIDSESWPILLRDLHTIYEQLDATQHAPLFHHQGTPFQAWAKRLQTYAQSAELEQAKSHWGTATQSIPIPLDYPNHRTVAAHHTMSIQLTPAETDSLLNVVPTAYNTRHEDILLTALYQVLAQWINHTLIPIELFTNGRITPFSDIKLTHTVGWFKTHYPIWLKVDQQSNLGHLIRSVKEQLRQLSAQEIGYDVLRYLTNAPQLKPTAPIAFYKIDSLQATETPFGEITNFQQTLGTQRPYILEISWQIDEGQLQVNWTYNQTLHKESTIAHLTDHFTTALRALIRHCQSQKARSYTPSDFPLIKVEQHTLNKLIQNSSSIESIYPLTPMQEGILFHTLYAKDEVMYMTQLSCLLQGPLNRAAFRSIWQQMIDRHPILRTRFSWEHEDKPLQIVEQMGSLPLTELDWRNLSDTEQRDALQKILQTDQEDAFDLRQAPLIRLTLIQLSDERHHFIWSHHHLLMDGWSQAILLQEIFTAYEAIQQHRSLNLMPSYPYETYIAWLQAQSMKAAELFWRQYLHGFKMPTPLGRNQQARQFNKSTSSFAQRHIRLTADIRTKLESVSKESRLTLNTFIQGAWILLLSYYSDIKDIVFGVTVSGRPVDLTNADNMLGLFINTLPTRAQITAQIELITWLQALQKEQIEARQYEYSPLARIQKWSQIPQTYPLFESLVVFERYPIESALKKLEGHLKIENLRTNLKESYPLVVTIIPEDEILIQIRYDNERFSEGEIKQMLSHIHTLIDTFTTQFNQTLSYYLNKLAEIEKQQQVQKGEKLKATSLHKLKAARRRKVIK